MTVPITISGGPAMSKAFLGGFVIIAILAVTGVDHLDQARRGAGAGLDVYERGTAINPRLRELQNVVLLPHMGSATVEGRIEMGEKIIFNIKTFADGHRPPALVVPGLL